MNNSTYTLSISGRVQGVGFRPFVYKLATKLHLKGYVTNDDNGVFIVAQAEEKTIDLFCTALQQECPPGAIVFAITKEKKDITQELVGFYIKKTDSYTTIDIPLTPDFTICKECGEELLDHSNRRYHYPFISCVNCGPRYAITQFFPFERENTSYASFPMCNACEKEYQNSANRRFHSQINSCSSCGVQLTFTNANNEVLSTQVEAIFLEVVAQLQLGKIIAVKNTSGYLLLCDATHRQAISNLRVRKRRPTKPFAVLFKDCDEIKKELLVRTVEEKALTSAAAPIVVLETINETVLPIDILSPNLSTIGAMLPNSGLLKLLITRYPNPLVATSGNSHGAPICATTSEAIANLGHVADFFIHHNLTIEHSQDDSVLKFSSKTNQKILLRRARGFAPNEVHFERKVSAEKVMALGADLKSTVSIIPNQNSYISQYLGNLENYDTALRFEKTIKQYTTIFNFEPEVVLKDKHPKFYSANFVNSLDKSVKVFEIQHHVAHFSAILGEKKLWDANEKILGFVWDGIGYASSDEIWGGEIFEYQNFSISRKGHFDYYPWILGDKMSKSPCLAAFSLSEDTSDFASFFTSNEVKIFEKRKAEFSLKTTSVGRLFDAVAFVLGFEKENSFEGEASMYVESLAKKALQKEALELVDYLSDSTFKQHLFPTNELFNIVCKAAKKEVDKEKIALHFHYTLVCGIQKLATQTTITNLAFTGGVFQNEVLIDLIRVKLSNSHKLHFHDALSANDENISYGQLQYYLHILKKTQKDEYK